MGCAKLLQPNGPSGSCLSSNFEKQSHDVLSLHRTCVDSKCFHTDPSTSIQSGTFLPAVKILNPGVV